MQTAVKATNISKTYKNNGHHKAVDQVDLEIRAGEIYSLLGPNGAGKTTLLSILTGLLEPDGDGQVFIQDVPLRSQPLKAKALFGLVPQEVALYDTLSARENLIFWGQMAGLNGRQLQKRVSEILDTIGLAARASERIDRYSGGMKRRVNIGAALLHQPSVVFMDEPTVGIDPQSRRSILDAVLELRRQGSTVIYTTHYMEEAQELSDRIGVMDKGRLIAQGTHAELIRQVGELARLTLITDKAPENLVSEWARLSETGQIHIAEGQIEVLARDSNLVLPQLFESAGRNNVRISQVNIHEPNLETVFLSLTGRALRDG